MGPNKMFNPGLRKILTAAFLLFSHPAISADPLTIYTVHEPPLNFAVGEDKNSASDDMVQGFSVDVVREIMLRTQTNGSITIAPWPRSYRRLESEPNIVLFSMARTPLREHLFQWVGPLSFSKSLLYMKRGRGIKIDTLDDARKLKSIAVIPADSKEQYLRSHNFTNLDSSYLGNAWHSVYGKLLRGRVDALADTDMDFPIKARENNANPDQFEPVYELFLTRLYIGFSKSTQPDIVAKWQTALNEIKRDGTFEHLAQKWSQYWQVKWIVKDGALQTQH